MNSSSARIGYARVSTADQNLDAQMAALQAAGCTMVRTETGDGATLAVRPELRTILDFIHPGAYRGRPPRIDMEAIKHRLAMGLSPTAIARELGISRGTVYKARADVA